MVARKRKRKTVKRKRTTARKKTTKNASFFKNMNNMGPKILQSIGAFTVFFVIFAILSGIVLFRWIDTANERYNLRIEEEYRNEQRADFIQTIAPTAQRLQRQYGVLASISMAQAALESNYGESELSADYNNLYGVKTEPADPENVLFTTSEYINGEWIEIEDYFKVYPSWEASMESHAELIYHGTSWDPYFYQEVLAGNDYYEQAQGLQEAGYATDPTYADKLIEMIDAWELAQYDQPM